MDKLMKYLYLSHIICVSHHLNIHGCKAVVSQKLNFSPEPSSTHTPLGCVSEQLRLCRSLAKATLFRKLKKIAHAYLVAYILTLLT